MWGSTAWWGRASHTSTSTTHSTGEREMGLAVYCCHSLGLQLQCTAGCTACVIACGSTVPPHAPSTGRMHSAQVGVGSSACTAPLTNSLHRTLYCSHIPCITLLTRTAPTVPLPPVPQYAGGAAGSAGPHPLLLPARPGGAGCPGGLRQCGLHERGRRTGTCPLPCLAMPAVPCLEMPGRALLHLALPTHAQLQEVW